jgi:hypothetical protein
LSCHRAILKLLLDELIESVLVSVRKEETPSEQTLEEAKETDSQGEFTQAEVDETLRNLGKRYGEIVLHERKRVSSLIGFQLEDENS